jgi:geranylgeranyl diphosphate synthase, type I
MASFSLGWTGLDSASPAGGRRGGKGLRPAIVLLCAQAMGAPVRLAMPGAVAVELVHAFSLVHDDIMDRDEHRRHRATTWKAYGTGPAVLTGDAMLALAISTLAREPAAGAAAALEWLSATLVELVAGQAEDIGFERRPWTGPGAVTIEEYLAMAEAKSGSLIGCSAAIGTLLGGGSAADAARMSAIGRRIGLAFQITDDILGIWGDPSVTGKSASSDLTSGKKTFPVLAALATDTDAARELSTRIGEAADRLPEITALIEQAGGRELARTRARLILDDALRDLAEMRPSEPSAYDELAVLGRYMMHRNH